jgi:sec-independent protein translocase protein TatB
MLEIGWGKIVLIGIVALLVIGPKELPAVLRTVGQWMTKLRRMAGEFQTQFQEAMREAEMADLKKQVDDMTSQAQSYANFDPIGEVRKEFESTQQQIESAIADPSAATSLPATPQLPESSAPDSSAPVSSEPPLAPSTGAEPNAPSSTVEPVAVGTDAGKPDAGGKPA